MSTVSNSAVKDLVETCLELEVLSMADLSRLGLDLRLIQDPELRCAETQLINLWRYIDENAERPDIGFKVGNSMNSQSKGVLASWVSQADSLREAFEIFRDNIHLMNPSERWLIEEDQDNFTFRYVLDASKGYPDIAVERSITALVKWGRSLSGAAFPVNSVALHYAKPSHAHQLTTFFHCDVQFSCSENSLSIAREHIELPVLNSNAFLKKHMEKTASQINTKLSAEDAFKRTVVETIERNWAAFEDVSAERACRVLSVSRQTLFRKLKKEGTDYRKLVDQFKKEQALKLLQSPNRSITRVAFELGYKDASSFTKAFKRWYGTTPGQYLKQLL